MISDGFSTNELSIVRLSLSLEEKRRGELRAMGSRRETRHTAMSSILLLLLPGIWSPRFLACQFGNVVL